MYEKRITEIAKKYMMTSFWIDFFACVPVLIYEGRYGFSTDHNKVNFMIHSEWYQFWSFLKVLRILQFDRIKNVLFRSHGVLDEIFPMKKVLILNIRTIMWVALRFTIFTHIMICVWVAVTSNRFEEAEVESILTDYEPNEILVICLNYYVETMYFVVMTQTTVGYGVPYSYELNITEMVFIMIM